jgi:hypothetical protein
VIGDVEKNARKAHEESDRQELRHAEKMRPSRKRHGREHERAEEVASDHERTLARSIDEAARQRADNETGCHGDRGEQAELEGRSLHGEDGRVRNAFARDARAEIRDGLRSP